MRSKRSDMRQGRKIRHRTQIFESDTQNPACSRTSTCRSPSTATRPRIAKKQVLFDLVHVNVNNGQVEAFVPALSHSTTSLVSEELSKDVNVLLLLLYILATQNKRDRSGKRENKVKGNVHCRKM